MKVGKGDSLDIKVTNNGEDIERVTEFCYLGSIITDDAKCHREIRRRIAMGKESFLRKNELMRGGLSKELKKRIIKTMVWSIVLYGSETWTVRMEDIRKLEDFEMWLWRRMERISWTQHETNEEVLKIVGEERMIIKIIRKRQKSWIGHVLRENSLFRMITEGRRVGRKQRGRPRIMMLD